MEVHHHAHNDTTIHRRKNWSHYFWEFLMLFLAVFCGFLAEYQLEHKIEKEKARQYIHSFYEDLKSDTAEFSWLIAAYDKKEAVFSKSRECFDALPGQLKSSKPCIAELYAYASEFPDMMNEDRTMQQLKNAGELRVLKQADADSIQSYDWLIRMHIKSEATGLQQVQYRLRTLMSEMINYENLSRESEDPSVPYLNSTNKDMINKFFVTLNEYRHNCNENVISLQWIQQKAVALLGYFKNKYQLE